MQAVAQNQSIEPEPFELIRKRRAAPSPSPSALAACGVALVVLGSLLGAESCAGIEGSPALEPMPVGAARVASL